MLLRRCYAMSGTDIAYAAAPLPALVLGRSGPFSEMPLIPAGDYAARCAIYGGNAAIYGGNAVIYGGSTAIHGCNASINGGSAAIYGGFSPALTTMAGGAGCSANTLRGYLYALYGTELGYGATGCAVLGYGATGYAVLSSGMVLRAVRY
eukprot:3124154-Rhodomonas_salina.1